MDENNQFNSIISNGDVEEPENNNSNYRYVLYAATAIVAAAGLYVAWLYVSSKKDWGYEIEWKFWNSSLLWPALSVIGFFLQFIDWQHTSFTEGWVVKDSWGREKFVENNDIMSFLWGNCLFPLLAHFLLIPCIYGAILYYVVIIPLALVNALIPYLAALLSVAIAVFFYFMARNYEWRKSPYLWLIPTAFISLALIGLLSLPTNERFNFGSNRESSVMPILPNAIGHATVTTKVANLRTGPGTDYDFYFQQNGEKLQVTQGNDIQIVEDCGEWYKILTSDNGIAYIKKTLCSDMEYYRTSEVVEEDPECDTDEEMAETVDAGTIIYQSGTEAFYCDGQYVNDDGGEQAQYFSTDLSGLNRNHFSLSFDFIPKNSGDVLVLSSGWRILSVYLQDDETVCIKTNNMENKYNTSIHYSMNESNHIDVEYNNGTLIVNGYEQSAELDTENGDNTLSSQNFSYGGAFKGTLKNIVVTSY